MKDEEIRQATASEPLTLEEEYSMQRSWRNDADKLTFIVCTHPGEQYFDDIIQASQAPPIVAGQQDSPEWMVGDVNLFLNDDDDEDEDRDEERGEANHDKPKSVIGELEIMIARKDQQGKGLARETLVAFMSYVQASLPNILLEYAGPRAVALKYLRVKIDKDNVRSLRLFERVGFVRASAEPNYFGEVELRTPVVGGMLWDVENKIGLAGYGKQLRYESNTLG
ncbi:N-acetyltransferase [Stagonosporopsis vannaccii]|nr:N-acetyltransferase [Stagonosporopsis vannaccii]